MKSYTINQRGDVPSFIANQIKQFNGMPATKENFELLNAEISFIVVDCGEAHGNVDQGVEVGGAWLCPKNNDNSWNVLIQLTSPVAPAANRSVKTFSAEQWSEIEKLASVNRIKNQLADLLEASPELNLADICEFIQSLTERELDRRRSKIS